MKHFPPIEIIFGATKERLTELVWITGVNSVEHRMKEQRNNG
jgi:hypothetical protein